MILVEIGIHNKDDELERFESGDMFMQAIVDVVRSVAGVDEAELVVVTLNDISGCNVDRFAQVEISAGDYDSVERRCMRGKVRSALRNALGDDVIIYPPAG